MDGVSKTVLTFLSGLRSALGGPDPAQAAAKVGLPALKLLPLHLSSPYSQIVEAALDILDKLAQQPCCKAALQSGGVVPALETMASHPEYGRRVTTLLATIAASSAAPADAGAVTGKPAAKAAAPATDAAPPAAAAALRPRRVHINMVGLLGDKAKEDRYIRAMLLEEGVTSVTLDRRRELAVVFTHAKDATPAALCARLYRVVQEVCDSVRDAEGRQRIVVKGAAGVAAASYLADDDDDDDEDAEAGGGAQQAGKPGGKGKAASALTNNAAGRTAGLSAAERLKERQGQAAGAGGGWLSSIFSFW